ncbi:hypothetical protein [Okeania hirsuta]|uniref:hypothetical protein n=1 Tax=Okeania hirsuta TaxID=1458930 RepID=UPI001961DA96|nr:hypothetical protein [Okeania hirsuta]
MPGLNLAFPPATKKLTEATSEAKPQWAALDTAGQIVSKNRFQWMNAFDRRCRNLF